MDQIIKAHGAMAQLISEVEAFVALRGGKPGTVLAHAGGLGGQVWGNWCSGRASCTLPMADRIRRYMADNWPEGHAMPFNRPHPQRGCRVMAQTETPLSSDAGPLQAVWRHTKALCGQCERIEIGFALPDGGVLRVSLSSGDARHLAETLAGFLADGPLPAGFVCRPCHAGVQSARSAGSPHLSDSMPPGIANV